MTAAPYHDTQCGREGGFYVEPSARCATCRSAFDLLAVYVDGDIVGYRCREKHDPRRTDLDGDMPELRRRPRERRLGAVAGN